MTQLIIRMLFLIPVCFASGLKAQSSTPSQPLPQGRQAMHKPLPDIPIDSLILLLPVIADTGIPTALHYGRLLEADLRNEGDNPLLARLHLVLGDLEYAQHHLDSALQYYQLAQAGFEQAGLEDAQAEAGNRAGIVLDDLGQYSEALRQYNNALRYFKQMEDTAGLTMVLNNIGIAHENLGNYQQALDFHTEVLAYAKSRKDSLDQATALVNIGGIYATWGNYSLALENYLKALGYYIVKALPEQQAWVLNHLGNLYLDWENYSLAAQYYLEAYRLYREEGNTAGEAKVVNNLAIVYQEVGEADTALAYYHKSLELEYQNGDMKGIAESMINLGSFYYEIKEYPQAENYFIQARRMYEDLRSATGLTSAYANLAKVYSATDRNKLAREFFLKSLAGLKNQKNTIQEMDILDGLASLSAKEGNYRSAYAYLSAHNKLRDSVFSIQTEQRMLDLYHSYENERKRQEIELLNQENELRKIDLRDKRDRIRRQQITMIITIVIVLILLVLILLLHRQSSQRKRINRQLEKKNQEILDGRLELLKAKEKAETADRLKTAFLANMSHEIRTPMNAIIGFTSLLSLEDYSEEQKKEFLHLISINSNHLMGLIEDILDTAKLESGQINIQKRPSDIRAMLNEVYLSFLESRKAAEKEHIDLIMQLPPDGISLEHQTDPVRFRQVFNNLLENALKFTEEGEIRFGCQRQNDEGHWVFFVADSGIGIPLEKQDMIFERFLQVDNSHTRRYGGSGLGLSICRALVALMGGNIWLDSTPGKGSTFYFTIGDIPQA
jgi:signal transduction histidine kinase